MTINNDIETIVWDLDGTLLDSFGIYQEILGKVFRAHGIIKPTEIILRNNHHGTLQESISNILHDMEYEADEAEIERLHREFLLEETTYMDEVDSHLYPDAAALCQKMHQAGLYQIIVTNRIHGHERQNASPKTMIQNSQLRDYIDDVICGDDSEHRKPKREVLVPAFGEHLIKFENSVVIGDQFVDAAFARNLDVRAILVQRASQIAHLEKLGNWQDFVSIVSTLDEVAIAPRPSSL
jgi:phosphoglycolate phosphatase-like HAD superfamily hydrolase